MPGIGGYPSLRFGEHRSGWQLIHEPGRIGRNGYLDTPLRIACHILPGDHIVQVGPHTHHAFIIYHPALTYLARDYGLQQIALENEGKEPSAEHMRRIIDTARNLNLTKLFYQRQFSKSTVDALARELNIPAVPIDPLAPDVINNTLEISKLIAQP